MAALPTVDWVTREITIPKAYEGLTVLQPSPEILELDTNRFRNDLRTLEASEEGTYREKTHNHNTEVTVSGITLARVVEILAPYTITFEDGQYRVILQGSNNNILDVANVNQVSIAPNNSAGLISNQAIEFSEYREGVTIDVNSVASGTLYPVGTLRRPANNIPDANVIANARGFDIFYIKGNYTFDTGDDISNKIIIGDNELLSALTINPGSLTTNAEIRNAAITGTLDGNTKLVGCDLENLEYVNGRCVGCRLKPGTFRLGGNALVSLINCYSGVAGQDTPTIDMNGLSNSENPDFIMRGYSGGIRLRELTQGGIGSIDLVSGQVRIVLASMTNGELTIRGNCKVVDDTTGELLGSGTYNGGFVLNVEATTGIQLTDSWQRLGLDPQNPLRTFDDNRIEIGPPGSPIKVIEAVNDATFTTQTRNDP